DVLALNPDGVFLSNGPGDPAACDYAIEAVKTIVETTEIPVFGICLGHQILALASGAKTLKMPHGHHGANHPVQNLDNGTVMITSQNHGFAVDESNLPDVLRVTHRSRSEEHTSELQSRENLVCRLLLEKKKHLPAASNTA